MFRAISTSAVAVVISAALAGCNELTGSSTDRALNDIHKKVAADATKQYEIAARQGDPIQVCVQAGIVAAAHLQANNESEYRLWKETEANDCRRAGVPI